VGNRNKIPKRILGPKAAEVAGMWTTLHLEGDRNFTSPNVSAVY
jgi:hypothetical protein